MHARIEPGTEPAAPGGGACGQGGICGRGVGRQPRNRLVRRRGDGRHSRGLAALERSDYPDALRELVPAAEQGDAAAQAALGRMYLYGWGVAKEPAVAARWLQRAAESGHAGSQRLLAHLYESGTGVPKDVAQAERWRQASAAAASKAAPRPPVRYKDYEDRNLVIDGKVYPQETALMRAIKRGDREAVLALLGLGADVNATAGDHTALTIAVIYFPAVVEVLLAHGADPRGRSGSGDQPFRSCSKRDGMPDRQTTARAWRRCAVSSRQAPM